MSQGSYQVATGGTVSAVTFAGQCNIAWQALASKNSGASAPTNGPSSAALANQDWFDTTNSSYPDWKLYDGAQWPRIGTLDTVDHNWFPVVGGGLATLASATTTNLGASRQTTLVISGSTTITSFGSSAQVGERKILKFSGSPQITHSSSIVCPGAANIVPLPGDKCEVVYIGAGAWEVLWFFEVSSIVGGGVPTGAILADPYRTTPPTGWVRANGGTVGNASSNATELASDAAYNLFVYLWSAHSNDSEIAIFTSGGSSSTFGASAAADWAANKAVTTTDMRGRLFGGIDKMGAASAASRITSTTASPDGQTVGAVGGAQTVTLIAANHASHVHTGTTDNGGTDHNHSANSPFTTGQFAIGSGGPPISYSSNSGSQLNWTTGGASAYIHNHTFTTAAQGSATPVNKMPPFKLGVWLQKL